MSPCTTLPLTVGPESRNCPYLKRVYRVRLLRLSEIAVEAGPPLSSQASRDGNGANTISTPLVETARRPGDQVVRTAVPDNDQLNVELVVIIFIFDLYIPVPFPHPFTARRDRLIQFMWLKWS